jgi:hypothetical protein
MRDNTLELVVGLTLHDAVTPEGIPDAVSVTGPLNPPTSVTLMVSVLPEFRLIVIVDAVGANVKLPVPEVVIVTGMVIDSDVGTEVTVTVMVAVPVAVLLAAIVSVSPLIVTVTPVLELVAIRVTVPVAPVIVRGQVVLLPCCKVKPPPQEDETLKPPVTVSVYVLVAMNVPEVPVMVKT